MNESQGFRTKPLDPDFRRDPKTGCYCALCQKDIKGEPRFYAHMIHGCFEAVHPEDREIANAMVVEHDNFGLLPVGPDCARVIGREFVYTAEEAAAVREREATPSQSTTQPPPPGR
ncbi:hypothetical protein OIU34_24270 [Pararhizobium sp. BT-229]|uniref:hypothetical protein n=1 Tax=Pararhizobium sp. BT-229 TaxID=2986923 RepID=UPI0021F7D243|nr:hypothetical protein [Pararhizobium sp. BT-229]MCV9965016.1 hypothetical protein [Pararhizobium sp. BT-229]